MPPELKKIIQDLPPSSVNNSREMVRNAWKRAEQKSWNPMVAARIMEKVGVHLDPDRSEKDYGGEKQKHENRGN